MEERTSTERTAVGPGQDDVPARSTAAQGVRRLRLSHRRGGRAALMVDDGGEVRIQVGEPAWLEQLAEELAVRHGLVKVRRAEWGRSRA